MLVTLVSFTSDFPDFTTDSNSNAVSSYSVVLRTSVTISIKVYSAGFYMAFYTEVHSSPFSVIEISPICDKFCSGGATSGTGSSSGKFGVEETVVAGYFILGRSGTALVIRHQSF